MSALAAGFGVADITPATPTRLSGFAGRSGLSEGSLDPLTARALALREGDQTVALVALDLIGVPDELAVLLAARLGANAPKLILAATHTHAGPPVLSRSLLGAPPPGYLDFLAGRCSQAILAALADLRPAVVSCGRAPVVDVAKNRRDPAGPVDPFVDVVTLRPIDGAAPILWMSFACHPVVLGPDNLRFSADYPGAARQRVEREGMRCLFTTGCAGEINLGHSAADSVRRIGMEKRTYAEAGRIGAIVGEAALAACAEAAPGDAPLRFAARQAPARIDAPDAAAREAIRIAAQSRLDDSSAAPGERSMAQIDLDWLAAPRPMVPDLPVSALCFGPVRAAFLPGEIFVETALALKARAPGAVIVGYAGANPGYIPPANARGGYEVDIAWRPYGAPGPFAPGMAEALADAAGALLAQVSRA